MQQEKQYWFVCRESDLVIIDGGFETQEDANEILADIDREGYKVVLGRRDGIIVSEA